MHHGDLTRCRRLLKSQVALLAAILDSIGVRHNVSYKIMKKAKAVKQKANGRPSSSLMGFRADPMTRAAIAKWARNQPDKPTLSRAIRQLVELGLSVMARSKQTSRARASEANAMAADQLDRLADPSATAEEQATRKGRLLRGPEEFRELRVDRPKRT